MIPSIPRPALVMLLSWSATSASLYALPVQAPRVSDPGLDFVLRCNQFDTAQRGEAPAFTLRETNVLTLAATGAIRLYQIFVSSQDMPVCNFTPSCSRFGMAAIRQYGLVIGGLMTADRLLRCNGLGREQYPIDAGTGKCFDPPEKENPWGRRAARGRP